MLSGFFPHSWASAGKITALGAIHPRQGNRGNIVSLSLSRARPRDMLPAEVSRFEHHSLGRATPTGTPRQPSEDVQQRDAETWKSLWEIGQRVNAARRRTSDRGVQTEIRRLTVLSDRLKTTVASGASGAVAVTNAWLKMHEMLHRRRLLDDYLGGAGPAGPGSPPPVVLRAFFNAELPGAFIAAAHHFVRTWNGKPSGEAPLLDWYASSLVGGASALDDGYGVLAANRARWLMAAPGPSPARKRKTPADPWHNNGDVTDARCVRDLCQRALAAWHGQRPQFYCSDAAGDVSLDWDREEHLTWPLLLGGVALGVALLAEGGTMTVKLFTFCLPPTVGLVALVTSLFGEVAFDKPSTSRCANSEVYLVARKLSPRAQPGAADEAAERLADLLSRGPEAAARYFAAAARPSVVGESFWLSVAAAARERCVQRQIACIELACSRAAKRGAGREEDDDEEEEKQTRAAADAWLAQHPVAALPEADRLAHGSPASSSAIARSYAALPVAQSLAERGRSDDYHLRRLSNAIKDALFADHDPRRRSRDCRVLDVACGRGGDVRKLWLAGIGLYVGIDCCAERIEHARGRIQELGRAAPGAMRASVADFLAPETWPEALAAADARFDVVLTHMCVHYFMTSREAAERWIARIAGWLAGSGAAWITTCVDSQELLRRVDGRPAPAAPGDDEEPARRHWSNRLCEIEWYPPAEQKAAWPRYRFRMGDSVCADEFLVDAAWVEAVAGRCGLKRVEHTRFDRRREWAAHARSLSREEQEVARLYTTLVFVKS